MKLYWAMMSPFVRKVMIVAHEVGQAQAITVTDTAVGMTNPHFELMAENPLNKIPTLVLDDGTPLYDSRTICEYLDTLFGRGQFFPVGAGRWDALRRQSLGDGVMDALLLWRQERLKSIERQVPELLRTFNLKVEKSLDQLEARSAELEGKQFDIGQVALVCMLSYLDLRFSDLEWRNRRPGIAGWHSMAALRPSVQATEPRPAQAQNGSGPERQP